MTQVLIPQTLEISQQTDPVMVGGNQHVIEHVAPARDVFLALIERASCDASVDISKMKELLALRKEHMAEQARAAFDDAMNRTQREMRAIAADANNPQTKSKYASYFALDKVLRPIYTKQGFALSFNTAEGAPESYVRVVCDVSCVGHSRRYQIDMPADGKGAKGGDVMTKTHAIGAGVTYGQRYLLKMIFNIAIGDDTDGNEDRGTLSESQVFAVEKALEESGAPRERLLKYVSKLVNQDIPRIEDIPAAQYENAIGRLRSFKETKA